MAMGAYLDIRTRRVPNRYWFALSAFGMACIPVQLHIDEEPLQYSLILVPILAILADIYWESKKEGTLANLAPVIKYTAAIASIIVLGYVWQEQAYFHYLLAVPILMLVFVLLYMVDVIRGGADAKALIALAVMFPSVPRISEFPLIASDIETFNLVFPFAFVLLVNAAIIVAFTPLYFLFRNLANGEFRWPQAFVGYKLDVHEADSKFVWLMERVEKSKHILYSRPRREENLKEQLSLLAEAGYKRVWVTPKIPFIVPMLLSLILSAIVGNLILLIMPAL